MTLGRNPIATGLVTYFYNGAPAPMVLSGAVKSSAGLSTGPMDPSSVLSVSSLDLYVLFTSGSRLNLAPPGARRPC